MVRKHLFTLILVATLISPSWLQAADASRVGSLVRPSTAAASSARSVVTSGAVTPSSLVINRARIFGSQTSASGTRYWAVRDSDLIGKTPDEIIQRLSPSPVRAGDGVRTMEIVVDLKHPITLYQQANIGTVVVESSPSLRQIQVHSSIFATNLTVIPKH
jgi:hypothetical protein